MRGDQMKNTFGTRGLRRLVPALGPALIPVALAVCAALPATAREPYTKAELEQQEAKLLVLVDKGRDLWHGSKPEMASNGLACGNCHPDATASNPQTFPKFLPQFNKVVPFREMVNWCIQNPQAGKALDVNGEEMTAMEAYAFYLYRGAPIEPGLATRQTMSIAVPYGVGYPKRPSGIGVDTK
jgi:thiosulfate dehydrogenase